jgi:hypothetical protein
MNYKLERKCKEAAVAEFKVLFQHLPGKPTKISIE